MKSSRCSMVSRYHVLFVATGDVCRSPLAERIFRAQLGAALGPRMRSFRTQSAGTWGHSGAPMEPHARETLREFGANVGSFAARELSAEMVLASDLILTATAEHADYVRVLGTDAAGRTFTLREMARLCTVVPRSHDAVSDPIERARTLVERADALRQTLPGPRGGGDDIRDPFGGPPRLFQACAREIADALAALMAHLSPGVPESAARVGRSPAMTLATQVVDLTG